MRAVLGLLLVLMIAVPATAARIADEAPTFVVPGQRIGPVHLGMPRARIEQINENSPCPVLATYSASGRSTWLQTDWGGGCLVSAKIQVGLPFGPVLRAFGRPDRVAEDARYPHAAAVWIVYQDRGIAFRVLGGHSGTTIQAIAVFPGLAARASAQDRTTRLAGPPAP